MSGTKVIGLVDLASLSDVEFVLNLTMGSGVPFVDTDFTCTIMAHGFSEHGTEPATAALLVIVGLIFTHDAFSLFRVWLMARDASVALRGPFRRYSAGGTLFARISTALVRSINCDSLDGDLSKRFDVVVRGHILVLSVIVRSDYIRRKSGLD